MKFVSKIVTSFGIGFLTLTFFTFLFFPNEVFSESLVFLRGLGVGDRGIDVLRLQQFLNTDPYTRVAISGAGSPGFETNYFGSLTRAAVNKFQKKFASEILFYWQAPTGYVGPKTLRKLNGIYEENRADSISQVPILVLPPVPKVTQQSSVVSPPAKIVAPPEVYGVSPLRVRAGDKVTVYGANFSSTDNTVHITFGQIKGRFDNLSSVDGKVISFIYQPPDVKVMTKDEILAMPAQILQGLLGPVEAVGGSIDDIVLPYRNMKNEDDLKRFLKDNGHTFEELYDFFYVTVENVYGQGTSPTAILSGLRKLSFGQNLSVSDNDTFFSRIISLFESLTPTAYAQGTPEGGYNSGIIMQCTCGDGYLTFILDYSQSGGSGLYWFSSSFRPNVGNPRMSGPHLGFFQRNAGQCSIEAGPTCVTITANLPQTPWGEAPMGGS